MKRNSHIQKIVERGLRSVLDVKSKLLTTAPETIAEIARVLIRTLRKRKTIYLIGNGGSAADAQHIACEFVGKFLKHRKPLNAIALTTNTSVLTAIGNDSGIEECFVRQVEAHVRKGDALIAISTSGNSPNVLKAVALAKKLGAITIALTGADGGKLASMVDVALKVPSDEVPRIQECHIAVGHIVCGIIEEVLSHDRRPRY